jgi:hypothetical protein
MLLHEYCPDRVYQSTLTASPAHTAVLEHLPQVLRIATLP